MKIIGKTTEGNYVVSDIAALYFQEGIPPSIIFDNCKKIGIVPSFIHFYDELTVNGMTHDRIIHLLSEHVFESFGKEYRDVVINNLKIYASRKADREC